MNGRELLEEYKSKAVVAGLDPFFTASTVLEILRDCHSHNIAMIGLEGFDVTPSGGISSRMDLIFDESPDKQCGASIGSWSDFVKRANDKMRDVAQGYELPSQNPVLFTVVLMGENEW